MAGSKNAEVVYKIENQLATSHKTNIERRNVKANYNLVTQKVEFAADGQNFSADSKAMPRVDFLDSDTKLVQNFNQDGSFIKMIYDGEAYRYFSSSKATIVKEKIQVTDSYFIMLGAKTIEVENNVNAWAKVLGISKMKDFVKKNDLDISKSGDAAKVFGHFELNQ